MVIVAVVDGGRKAMDDEALFRFWVDVWRHLSHAVAALNQGTPSYALARRANADGTNTIIVSGSLGHARFTALTLELHRRPSSHVTISLHRGVTDDSPVRYGAIPLVDTERGTH